MGRGNWKGGIRRRKGGSEPGKGEGVVGGGSGKEEVGKCKWEEEREEEEK